MSEPALDLRAEELPRLWRVYASLRDGRIVERTTKFRTEHGARAFAARHPGDFAALGLTDEQNATSELAWARFEKEARVLRQSNNAMSLAWLPNSGGFVRRCLLRGIVLLGKAVRWLDARGR